MYKFFLFTTAYFFISQANVYGACSEIVEGDSEETIIKKSRDCRNYYRELKSGSANVDNSEAELSRVRGILDSTDRSFDSDADKTISKNSKSTSKNKKSIEKNKELIVENLELIDKNVKKIKKNEKLLKEVDEDLYKLEGNFAKFTDYQGVVNDLNAKAIGQNLGDIADIFKDLSKKQRAIVKNQIEIEENKATIAENFSESMRLLEEESENRKKELKELEDSLRSEISKKLNNVCDSIKYCGAANADVNSAKRGASINYNRRANVNSSSRSSKAIIDSLGISSFGEKGSTTLDQ
jgi:DNA repair exonuclease SbcCD ATPase subunit